MMQRKLLLKLKLHSTSIVCIMILLLFSIIIINPNSLSAFDSNKAYAATINPGTSLAITNPTLNTTISPGGIGYVSSNVTYSATDASSYMLRLTYASGYTGLTSGNNTIAGVTNGTTGSSMASSNTNAWGFGWGDTTTANANLQYYTMPAYGKTGTGIANGVVDSGTSRTEITKKIVFAAKFASNNTNSGNYKTNVLLSLVATPATITYTLSYDANSGTGAPSSQTYTGAETSYDFTIPNTPIPTRTGYKFLGWADTSNATAAAYQPGDTYSMSSTIGVNVAKTLYAVWQIFNDFPSTLTTMQGMTTAICSAASVGATKNLTDTRDNNTYTVTKLADGNCWMTQNLRLAGGTTITSADSNVTSNYTLPASTDVFGAAIVGCGSYMLDSANDEYGAYYTLNVASAGACRAPTTDICPKNWHLPTYTDNSFKTLYDLYNTKIGTWSDGSTSGYWLGASTTVAGGVFLPASGTVCAESGVPDLEGDAEEVTCSGAVSIGVEGGYWLGRAAFDAFIGYIMKISDGNVDTRHTEPNSAGHSVRCVAK